MITLDAYRPGRGSPLEQAFAHQLDKAGIEYAVQVKPIPERRFAFDFHILGTNILVEVQGGVWTRGKHARGTGLRRDYEKTNLAQLNGWRVLQFAVNEVKSGAALEMIQEAVKHD